MINQEEEFPAQWALDLLRGETIYKEAFYTKYLTEITCTMCGGGSMIFANKLMQRPIYSSLPWHFVCTAIGFGIGRIAASIANHNYAKRDAMMVDYIKRHPERFPAPRNKKLAELIEPWCPIR